MSGTPPSVRKRPQCHSCGTLMAGHRRMNGRYVCPDEDDTNYTNTETTTPSPRRSARINSHSREQQTPPPPPPPPSSSSHSRPGPSNWDPQSRSSRSTKRERTTSPAPTVLSEEYCKTEDDSFYTDDGFVGSSSTPRPPHAVKISRKSSLHTFTRKLRLSTPLASIFTARRSEIEEVQQEAGRHGLYTGTVYKPRKIKEEESQRWMVMGSDPDAVDRLVDYQRRDVVRQLELESRGSTPVPATVVAPPPIVTAAWSSGGRLLKSFVKLALGGFVGALILLYMLIYVL